MKKILIAAAIMFAQQAMASQEYIVRANPNVSLDQIKQQTGAKEVVDLKFNNWVKVVVGNERSFNTNISRVASEVTKNIKFQIQLHRPKKQKREDSPFPFPLPGDGGDGGLDDIIGGIIGGGGGGGANKDPDFPKNITVGTGADPDFSQQWGMTDIGVKEAWSATTKGSPDMIVGVIDTGVDYTHDDLAANIWRNPGETGTDASGKDKATNGIDDDGNGYIDDVVGWDFAVNDNKPHDTTGGNPFFGGNPGHGTHCAGNIGAMADNGKGTVGVAPNVKIMALRFLTEKGQGDIAGAVQAIKYGVDNGAKVLSNSWGSEGDGGEGAPLQEAIQYAMDHGVLFVAAAGNGHSGVGYDNDTDAKPGVPASYSHDNIISVAALDKSNNRGSFSNWGLNTVDLGAPGVGVYSSIPGNKYMSMDGTSMACPIVAGAAALYWSQNPQASMMDVKNAILNSVRPVSSLKGKSVSGGKLNVKDLMSK
jgi:thermitase